MTTIIQIVGIIIGFVLLIKGADVFVEASVSIAKGLRIPSIVVGLTIVAIGTSLPELVVSVSAALGGSSDMAVANVVGSNIFNILFILGACALIKPINVLIKEIWRDFFVALVAAVALFAASLAFRIPNDMNILAFRGIIPRSISLAFLAAFILYMAVLVKSALKNRTPSPDEEADTPKKPLPISILFAVLGAGVIVLGGQITVSSAMDFALNIGISERVAGLTILAVGTSLPELVTSLVACKKGENGIAIGNVLGSNIFNILAVLGITGIISPLFIDLNMMFDLAFLALGSLVFFAFAATGKGLSRLEGGVMILFYSAYIVPFALLGS
ncbi:MAG: calcium/sodium antiporter [Defluviitaleaceae bacterium]|nr:calcium/sodium antiporter [Defluviitaleaceae bacterium]